MILQKKFTKKSVKIGIQDVRGLKKIRKTFDNDEEFAEHFGIVRTTLRRIMEVGRGSEENIVKIQNILNDQQN